MNMATPSSGACPNQRLFDFFFVEGESTRRRCPGVSQSLELCPRATGAVVASVDPIHDSKADVNGILDLYLLAKIDGDPMR